MSKQDQAIIEKLSKKNRKLRAALRIADEAFNGHFDDDCEECLKARAIIREALKP